MDHKLRVLVDFDGTIHRYSAGWKDGSTYDSPMPGAKESLETLEALGYEVVIFSTRDMHQIESWLEFWEFKAYPITNQKQPAVAIIDDRAIRFTNWSKALSDLDKYESSPVESLEDFMLRRKVYDLLLRSKHESKLAKSLLQTIKDYKLDDNG